MTSDDITQLPAWRIAELYRQGELSPVEVVRASLDRIAAANPQLNAFVLVDAEGALEQAGEAEAAFARGEDLPPLAGIPVSVKDNILTAGLRSTYGSPLFRDHVPETDSGVVAACRRAGAIILGKTNTPAFGWTGITDNLIFGATRNPWDPDLTPGGSSGGAAVAAATGMVPLSLGTDGGGSLRTPAAFTGIVGFKGTHGRFPDTPPHSHWLIQHYGPLARSVRDAAFFLDAVSGPDPNDPHSLPRYAGSFEAEARTTDLRPKALFTTQLGWVEQCDAEIARACRDVAIQMASLGWQMEERDLAWANPAPFADVISIVGFQHRLQGLTHRTSDIDPGILAMLERAEALPPNAFYDAYFARNAWCAGPAQLFEEIDLLLTPTVACLPFEIGRFSPAEINGEPVRPSAWNPYLRAFNLTGQPAISVRVGTSASGLPIGLQIVGAKGRDGLVLGAAGIVENLVHVPSWTPAKQAAPSEASS